MFVLFTRWGRIGQTGQYQRTPFASKEEAIAEFEKIFKSKSGNLWADRNKFERKPKKYKLMEVNYSKKHAKDLLAPIDWAKMDVDSNLSDELQVCSFAPSPNRFCLSFNTNTVVVAHHEDHF